MSTRSASRAPPLGPVLDFLRLLWRVDHALQKSSKRLARVSGVTAPQRLVLRIVGRFPGLPAGELAALLHLHPSTITGVLQRLEKRGWIRRRTDSRDRRRALFGLTERGRAFDAADHAEIESALEHALSAAGERRATAARRVLQDFADQLERAVE